MISGMGGPNTTELQRGCRNLPVTSNLGPCIRLVQTRRHLAFTAGGVLDPYTPDSPRGVDGGSFFKVGGASARQKIYNIFVIRTNNCDATSIEI